LANVTNTYSGGTGTPMIAYNLSLQKAIVSYDQTHVVTIGLTYELPVGRGKALAPHLHPALNAVLGGWKIQYIGNYNSGTPLSFAANSAASGTNVGGNRALLTNGDAGLGIPFNTSSFNAALLQVSNPTNQYLNTQFIKQPAPYTYGTAAANVAQIRGLWGRSENIALQKNWMVKERVRFQLRAEALNGFNRHTLGGISTNPNSTTFGDVTSVSGNRTMQLGTRIDF
jgi:hypothetical protein